MAKVLSELDKKTIQVVRQHRDGLEEEFFPPDDVLHLFAPYSRWYNIRVLRFVGIREWRGEDGETHVVPDIYIYKREEFPFEYSLQPVEGWERVILERIHGPVVAWRPPKNKEE